MTITKRCCRKHTSSIYYLVPFGVISKNIQLNIILYYVTKCSHSEFKIIRLFLRGGVIWRCSVFANILGGDTVIWIKNGRYSVFESPNGDGKMQFLIENPTVTVFLQKFDYDITVIIEKINGNTII